MGKWARAVCMSGLRSEIPMGKNPRADAGIIRGSCVYHGLIDGLFEVRVGVFQHEHRWDIQAVQQRQVQASALSSGVTYLMPPRSQCNVVCPIDIGYFDISRGSCSPQKHADSLLLPYGQ